MESKKQDRIKTELIDMEYREEIGGCQTGVVGSRGGGNWVTGARGTSFQLTDKSILGRDAHTAWDCI